MVLRLCCSLKSPCAFPVSVNGVSKMKRSVQTRQKEKRREEKRREEKRREEKRREEKRREEKETGGRTEVELALEGSEALLDLVRLEVFVHGDDLNILHVLRQRRSVHLAKRVS